MNRNILRKALLEQQKDFLSKDRGTVRGVLKSLQKHARSPHVVVISGLRRAGKSTLLAQLAHELGLQTVYFVNFEDERLLGFSLQDTDLLHEVLVELFGERRIFLLDEVQNLPGWERWVRRMAEAGHKFYLTGSNAALLDKERGTLLTGRHVSVDVFPFSFEEFGRFKKNDFPDIARLTTVDRGRLAGLFADYLFSGGIPDALKYPELDLHRTLYEDILYRDVAARHHIGEIKALKELAFTLISQVGSLVSFNKLKEQLKLGSVTTVKNYIDYLESSWLFSVVPVYDYSIRRQQIAPKKIYAVDMGLARSVGFSFSENRGKLFENVVYSHLRRREKDIYYYKTEDGREVDFYLPRVRQLIQATTVLSSSPATEEREINALWKAMEEQKTSEGFIITEGETRRLKSGSKGIHVQSIYEWLLMS